MRGMDWDHEVVVAFGQFLQKKLPPWAGATTLLKVSPYLLHPLIPFSYTLLALREVHT